MKCEGKMLFLHGNCSFVGRKTTRLMAEHNELGKWGEDEAVLLLQDEGYVILERDWRQDHRDLDIIAVSPQGDVLVIVEVKTRETDDCQQPEESVDRRKMRNLAIAANAYVKSARQDKELRFDIVSVVGKARQVESIRHIKDAFNPMLII